MKNSLLAAVAAIFVAVTPVAPTAAAPVQNEIMFLMDSSGGLYDSAYANWNAEINWVQNFINQTHRADGSNAYGITTFSGLNPNNYSYEQNIAGNGASGGVKVLHSLWPGASNPHPDGPATPSSEQQPADLSDFTSGITNNDFLRGYTRTTDALQYVHEQFQTLGGSGTNKFIIMLTDGGFTNGFLPADDQGYVSPILQTLRAEGFTIATVAIDPSQSEIGNLEAMVSDPDLLFNIAAFNDFSDFLPAAQVAVPAPAGLMFLALGAGAIVLRRRQAAI